VWIAVFDVGFVQRLKASKWFPACAGMTLTWGVAPGCDENAPLALPNGKKWGSTTAVKPSINAACTFCDNLPIVIPAQAGNHWLFG